MMDKYIFNNSSTMAGGFRVPFPRSPLRNRTAAAVEGSSRSARPSRAETISRDSGMATYRVTIPDRANPGEEFDVYAGQRIVRVRCPIGYKPGSDLQISVPLHVLKNESTEVVNYYGNNNNVMPGGENSEGVTRVPDQDLGSGEHAAYMVKVPEGVRGGQDFPVTIQGQKLMVKCPNMARPGMSVRVVPPIIDGRNDHRRNNSVDSSLGSTTTTKSPTQSLHKEDTQMFEVLVPKGVQPGHPFALRAGGVQVLVTCPIDAKVGQKIRFHLPKGLLKKHEGRKSEMAVIRLSYGEESGWTRTIRATDMKFQWTRLDERGNVEERKRFDAERSAYVLKLDFFNNDKHLRKGRVTLVTPDRGVVDSNIKMTDGSDLVTYSDIVSTQLKGYKEKVDWFHQKCDQLKVDWRQGHIRMNIRREFLLSDSIDSVMSLNQDDLRKTWRFEYQNEVMGVEAGVDAGGLKREWFTLVTQAIFDPSMGLWQWSETNQMCMQINPASATCCPEDHLICFRFLGRVMGKALFDNEIVNGHMVKHLYKHILGFPIMLKDLNDLHERYASSLMQITEENAEFLCLNFAETEELMGMKQMVELIPGGRETELTADNLPEYLEACFKYRMMGRYEAQLTELLLGFYDVVPAPLLTIFDFQELELLMCGLPTIDMGDWMTNTVYTGEYCTEGPRHQVCTWFWEVVSGYDQEMKARLLQFVTGTSGVPSLGFGYLQSNDGDIRKFTIQGVPIGNCAFPRSHTCFNRIDLPLYETKQDLEEKLKIAITMAGTGFDIE